ncbi:hypothetical protein V1478_002301 [Vespula squamosa]|uniref:Uncharacterized protein n=1 Tax=Vespula squamosa TaxID=30214 RepID=A0ABD2BVW6_VESSQ
MFRNNQKKEYGVNFRDMGRRDGYIQEGWRVRRYFDSAAQERPTKRVLDGKLRINPDKILES